jgi:rhodanese-related sulfurtransferase
VAQTGKLDEVVYTLPLPYIVEGALTMDEDDFEEQFGFVKPSVEETLVFSCKAGVRAASAAKLAEAAGYTDILVYDGGSNEWFS